MDTIYFCTMTFWEKRRIAREAVEKAKEQERIDETKKLIEAGELNPQMVRKFMESIPYETEVRIYPAQGGTIVITRNTSRNTHDDFRPWDYSEADQLKKAVNGPKR